MNVFTIGFTKKSAKTFFELIKKNDINLLIDIRLNNVSQLAGFTKGKDLEFFLKEICQCKYIHEINFAPTKDILDDYKSKRISWQEYESKFIYLLNKRDVISLFSTKGFLNHKNICLLCSEPTSEKCHRRLLAEYLREKFSNINIIHL